VRIKVDWGSRPLVAAAGALLALALAVAGCGGGDDDNASGNSGQAAKPVKLVMWDSGASFGLNQAQKDAFAEMVDEVNKRFEAAHPGVTIDTKHLSYSDFETKVPAAVASNTAPDVLYYGTDSLWKYTLPLNDMLSDEQKKTLKFLDQSVAAAQDRKLHILPFGAYEGVWMYNKALFEKNGIAVPQTQEEFVAACDKLNAAGIVPIRATFGDEYTMDRYVALLSGQLIPNITDWNAQKIAYTSPEFTAGVDAFMDMTKHKCWGPNPESKGVAGEGDQMFRSGKTAVQYVLAGPDVADYEKDIGKGNLGVFLQPALPGGKPSMDASLNYGFNIVKTTKEQKLAWEYISFWVAPEQQQLAWEKIAQLPNVTTANIESDEPVYKQMLEWAADPQFHLGAWPVTPEEFKVWNDLTPDVVAGRVGTNELLTKLQQAREASKG
jgi:raffinose/stachyose/melibiose transport system substrate-binding protein